jgi:hypothetical protein
LPAFIDAGRGFVRADFFHAALHARLREGQQFALGRAEKLGAWLIER